MIVLLSETSTYSRVMQQSTNVLFYPTLSLPTDLSNVRVPAELKHIIKQRKRN